MKFDWLPLEDLNVHPHPADDALATFERAFTPCVRCRRQVDHCTLMVPYVKLCTLRLIKTSGYTEQKLSYRTLHTVSSPSRLIDCIVQRWLTPILQAIHQFSTCLDPT